jgi:hypothetical protein
METEGDAHYGAEVEADGWVYLGDSQACVVQWLVAL